MKTMTSRRNRFACRILSAFIAFTFSFTSVVPPSYAQSIASLNLPVPGAMVTPSAAFVPVLLKGMTIYPENPLQFDFIIDSGNTDFKEDQIKAESQRLVKYFLASMTIPKDDLWVNLSPYEKDRIIPDELGKTELGRDMLAQDYILKQLTASLMYPEKELGKEFWNKVYKQAQEKFGTTEIPVDTFNKVWILPETATVYEHHEPRGVHGPEPNVVQGGQTVYIVEARLKVMLDSDYLAMSHNVTTSQGHKDVAGDVVTATEGSPRQGSDLVTPQIVREVILPEIQKEVNYGRNFAPLRQIYHSLILAKWYKETIKNSLLSKIYIDQKKIAGVNTDDPTLKDQIYAQYMEAYKKGVFNYIKEDYDRLSNETIPRKYFSGGEQLTQIPLTKTDNPVAGNGLEGKGHRVTVINTPQKDGASSPILGGPWTLKGARTILDNPGGYETKKIVNAIRKIGGSTRITEGDISRFKKMLSEGSGVVRAAAVQYLTREQKVDGYINALRSPYYWARLEAVENLGILRDRKCIAPLMRVVETDKTIKARKLAVDTILLFSGKQQDDLRLARDKLGNLVRNISNKHHDDDYYIYTFLSTVIDHENLGNKWRINFERGQFEDKEIGYSIETGPIENDYYINDTYMATQSVYAVYEDGYREDLGFKNMYDNYPPLAIPSARFEKKVVIPEVFEIVTQSSSPITRQEARAMIKGKLAPERHHLIDDDVIHVQLAMAYEGNFDVVYHPGPPEGIEIVRAKAVDQSSPSTGLGASSVAEDDDYVPPGYERRFSVEELYELEVHGIPPKGYLVHKGEISSEELYEQEVHGRPLEEHLFYEMFQREFQAGVRAGLHTFALIKPDAVRLGIQEEIIADVRAAGFDVVVGPRIRFNEAAAREFYKAHAGKDFFERDLIPYATSGDVIPLFVRSQIGSLRTVAELRDLQTRLWEKYHAELVENRLHVSDSTESALAESGVVFNAIAAQSSSPITPQEARAMIKGKLAPERHHLIDDTHVQLAMAYEGDFEVVYHPGPPESIEIVRGKKIDQSSSPVRDMEQLKIRLEEIERRIGKLRTEEIEEKVGRILDAARAGKVILRDKQVDILKHAGKSAVVVGQMDRSIAEAFGYVHQTVNAIVLTPDLEKVVLIRRAPHTTPYPFHLTIPGGHPSSGEADEEGITIRLKDELGLSSLEGKLREVRTYAYGFDEKTEKDKTKERRKLFIYQLTQEEYESVLEHNRQYRRLAQEGEENLRQVMEAEQESGRGDVWSYHEVGLDEIEGAAAAVDGESPYANKETRFIEAEDIVSGENIRQFFTPDLLDHLLDNANLVSRIKYDIGRMKRGEEAAAYKKVSPYKRLVFLGPLASGKSTQADTVAADLGVPHISVGELLRDILKFTEGGHLVAESKRGYLVDIVRGLGEEDTALIQERMQRGQLIENALTDKIVQTRLSQDDAREGFVLDGYPREESSARALEDFLSRRSAGIDRYVHIRVSESVSHGRLDAVNHDRGDRSDDKDKEAREERLRVFDEETLPVLASRKDRVVEIDGDQPQDYVADEIMDALFVSSQGENVGGIDMNDIDVNRQGMGVDIQFDPAQLQELIDAGIDGFAPVIINITPLPSVLPLLGLEPVIKEEPLELSSSG